MKIQATLVGVEMAFWGTWGEANEQVALECKTRGRKMEAFGRNNADVMLGH